MSTSSWPTQFPSGHFLRTAGRLFGLLACSGLISAPMIGCGQSVAQPSGAATTFGVVDDGVHCTLMKWPEGMAVMLVDRAESHGGTGTHDREKGERVQQGTATRSNGSSYKWEIKTSDGETGTIEINGNSYELEKGAVFSVEVTEDNVNVHQFELDLSNVRGGIDGCSDFLRENPAVVDALSSPEDE